VAELAYAADLKSADCKVLWVQVPPVLFKGEIMFRIHIDIPLQLSEEEAVAVTKQVIELLDKTKLLPIGVEQINYRLGNDEDRQNSNYLVKNEKGHVTNKKSNIYWL